jgi:hypothetical protein
MDLTVLERFAQPQLRARDAIDFARRLSHDDTTRYDLALALVPTWVSTFEELSITLDDLLEHVPPYENDALVEQ